MGLPARRSLLVTVESSRGFNIGECQMLFQRIPYSFGSFGSFRVSTYVQVYDLMYLLQGSGDIWIVNSVHICYCRKVVQNCCLITPATYLLCRLETKVVSK